MSRYEVLTDSFYEWELRGRGWNLMPFPVRLEPPFVPFAGHGPPITGERIDDGRHHTLLSWIVDGVQKIAKGREHRPAVHEFEEPEPELFDDDTPLAELQLAVPPSLRIDRDGAEQLLQRLPVGIRPLAFEVVGSSDAIVVQLVAREESTATLTHLLRAHFPDIVVTAPPKSLVDRWTAAAGNPLLVDFGLAREFMLPLRVHRSFDVDPLLTVAAALSDLTADETAALQVLFEPTRHPWPASVVQAVTSDDGKPFFVDAPEITARAKGKVGSPLFAAVVRIAVRSPDLGRAWDVARALGGALQASADPTGNELMPLANDEYDGEDHEEDFLLRRSRRPGMLISTEELVGLVHPPSSSVRVSKLVRVARKTKAAPDVALGRSVRLGVNAHAGTSIDVGLSAEQRSRHVYLVGASGTGKSTLLLNLITQDLESGQGVAVLDPHGDLVDQVLARVPENRVDDVVLFDPADAEYPVGFNILKAHSELEKTLLASDLVATFQRLSTSWGDQMTSVLGNAILAFLESERGGTVVDLRRFLVEKPFRDELLGTVRDPDVVYYWRKEFPLLLHKPQASILTRLDTFLRPKLVRHMVAQQDDRLDFAKIMNEGKIFLGRLSQGAIGEENAYLLGTFLVSKFQQTAMSRQEITEVERRPFYLYVDEFQHFVTPSMAQILAGARKYRLGLVLAHQDLRQLSMKSPEVLSSVLTNPCTRICFRVGDQDARTLAEGFSSFDTRDLQSLGVGQAIVRVERADFDFTLDTPRSPAVDEAVAEARRGTIVIRSRERYARKREEVEAILRSAIAAEPLIERATTTGGARQDPEIQESEEVRVPMPIAEEQETKRRRAKPFEPQSLTPPPAVPLAPTPGRGGPQHKYLQELIKRWAVAHDWQATIEERILDNLGSVDVALRKGERRVACEIAVTTTAEHEFENIQKCLAASFDAVVLVSSERAVLRKMRESVSDLADDQRARVHITTPEDTFALLESFEAEAAGATQTVRGYVVKTRYRAVAVGDQAAKREAVSKVVARALRRVTERR